MKRFAPYIIVPVAVFVAVIGQQGPGSMAGALRGDRPSQSEWRIPDTESFVVRSAASAREYEIMVALPQAYGKSDRRHPVLYVLDANGMFPLAVEIARFLMFEPLKEEPVIVGIGYPVGQYWNTLADRFQDFTPTPDPNFVRELAVRFEFTPKGSGGAGAFLSFISNELIPTVESRYRIDSRRRALHGYSLGGLFATYALFKRPQLFQNYIIGAPSLWWDRDAAWDLVRSDANGHRQLPAKVYLMVGSLDANHAAIVGRLGDELQALKYGGLVWRMEYFEYETHDSAIPLTLSRGLRWLYGNSEPRN